MADEGWSTSWISIRFSDDEGDTGFLRWYAPDGSNLVVVVPADDPVLRHIRAVPQMVSIAPVAARGMQRSLRDYVPAAATAGTTSLAEANGALRAKYGWRWTMDRLSRAAGRVIQRSRGDDVVLVLELAS